MMDMLNCRLLSFAVELDSLYPTILIEFKDLRQKKPANGNMKSSSEDETTSFTVN